MVLDGPETRGLDDGASGFFKIVATAWAIRWMSASGRPEMVGEEEGPGSKAVGSGSVVWAEEASGSPGAVSIAT